jgi:hypothetical protein
MTNGFCTTRKAAQIGQYNNGVYRSKLYLFLWYCQHFNLPDDVNAIITNHIREFWAYLRDNPIRFGGNTTQ